MPGEALPLPRGLRPIFALRYLGSLDPVHDRIDENDVEADDCCVSRVNCVLLRPCGVLSQDGSRVKKLQLSMLLS